jgi:hypothetical protein
MGGEMTEADRIAADIVALVERMDGPVNFLDIEREVHGFRAEEPPTWDFLFGNTNEETVLWGGMTKAGIAALHKVLDQQMVAFQYVNTLPYLLGEGFMLPYDNWSPTVLLPTKAANMQLGSGWLMRASSEFRDFTINNAVAQGKSGYRVLTPAPLRFTADRFSI